MLAVAKWEFIEKVRTKAFIIGLFMTPLLMGMGFILPRLLIENETKQSKTIGIIDETNWVAKAVKEKLSAKYKLPDGKPAYIVDIIPEDNFDLTLEGKKILASAKLISKEITGYFVIPSSIVDSGIVEYRSENVGNIEDQGRFSQLIESIIFEQRAKIVGLNPEVVKKLSKDVEVKTIKVSKDGNEKESGFMEVFFTGYIFVIMLMLLVITTGQMLIRSFVEEKANRIVEVLVSSCSSQELMSGKIIGLTGLGFTTIIFWITILVAANFAAPIPFVPGDNLLFLLLYFILGYFMYVAIFITAGSTVSTEQEAQQMTGYIVMLLMLPIFIAVPVMINPDSAMVKILSQIPLLTPTMMALRFSIQTPEWWEIALSIVSLSLTIYGLMWIASKVFRIGILVTGKKPNFKEIYGWLKTE